MNDIEEAISYIKNTKKHLLHLGETWYADYLDDAIELLKEQEWIPVTERLPDVRHAVLCYSPHHKNIWALSLHEDGEWYYWIPMYEKYNPDFEGPITHWMPLPEPPQKGR